MRSLALVMLAACSTSHNHISPGDAPGDGHTGSGSGSGSNPGDAGGGDAADIACSGTVSGGLSGTLSNCSTSYVFGSPNRTDTAILVTQLNGASLDGGPCSFDYLLHADPDTSTTYTFANIVGGVANLYKNHPTGPMTIWACGTNGTVTYGENLALRFTTVDFVGTVQGTKEWRVHGQVSCRLVAQDGSPPIDLALTF